MRAFEGTDRIRLLQTLGEGAYGVVYAAFDEERHETVAVKVLSKVSPEGLYRFKQEFRVVSGFTHPNLVTLHELHQEREQAFFTMELVDGRPFTSWVRQESRPPTSEDRTSSDGASRPSPPSGVSASRSDMATWSEGSGPLPDGSSEESSHPTASPLRYPDHLRRALTQLVDGVMAIHAFGRLHLDLKSSNVLVTEEGRVVILDFGLTRELDPMDGRHPVGRRMGTPSHMAPEVAAGQAPDEAADWYSVGVMLFEALTGRLPFTGQLIDIIRLRIQGQAPRVASLCPGLPEDLTQICDALLSRDPAARPRGETIRALLGHRSAEGPTIPLHAEFLGRQAEFQSLLDATLPDPAQPLTVVLLHGGSGMGKSFLLNRFLREVNRRLPWSAVLLGRSFEQENVPFKGLDGLVDALSSYLQHLESTDLEGLVPRHVRELVRLFPVLRQVPALAKGADLPSLESPAQDQRLKAFAALRDLLCRIGDTRPLVLALDDLQWADQDSVALLEELIRPPTPPRALLVLCYRSEEAQTAGPLRQLLDALGRQEHPITQLPLKALSTEAAQNMALLLGADQGRALQIVQAARGNPYFIQELAREGHTAITPLPDGGLAQLVLARARALSPAAQDALNLLAAAGYPLPWDLLHQAANLRGRGSETLAQLRAGHLARIRGGGRERFLEAYHDRVREAVVANLDPEVYRDCHLRLAHAWEGARAVDPRALANHYLAAGEVTQAAAYSARAARHVAESLAFERACQLYRISIQLREPADPELPTLRLGLADALANAGRGAEAAPLYLEACVGAEAAEVHRLRRRAMEEYFRSGHVSEGLAIAGQVLASLGLKMPSTPLRSALSLAFHRLRLKWRGLGFVERGGAEIQPALLDRIDTLWSMAMGLGPTDLIRAADFQSRQLLLALEAGEPRRILRGLAHETALRSGSGVNAAPEVRQIHSVAVALAERLGDPESMARAQIGAGIAALAMGQWRSALQGLDQAVITLQPCTGVAFERHLAQYYACQCAVLLGDLRGAARRHEAQFRLARMQGDRLTMAALTTDVGYLLRAAEDDPGRGLIELEESLVGWPDDRFLYTHFRSMMARGDLRLYQGNPGAAAAQVDRNWPDLQRSLLMNAEGIRITCWELRARVDLAQGQAGAAHGWTRKLLSEKAPYGAALGLKNLGVLAAQAGRRAEASDRLLEAELALREAELHLHAECLRWGRGRYLGGSTGEELQFQSEAWMSSQGIQNAKHLVRMLVSGLGR